MKSEEVVEVPAGRSLTNVIAIDSIEPNESTCGPIREFWQAMDGSCYLAHLIVLPDRQTERHWHEKLTEVYVCVKGTGVINIDAEEMELGPRQAVMIAPGKLHQLRNATTAELELYILAHPKFDPADVHLP
jgi:mannose-6-phosphate isomerase-like protein (cupin superfamily)